MKWLDCAFLGALSVLACAPAKHVRPPEDILDEAKTSPPDRACKLLSEALASGSYSSQRMNADTLHAVNIEYQLGQAREKYCREVERGTDRIRTGE